MEIDESGARPPVPQMAQPLEDLAVATFDPALRAKIMIRHANYFEVEAGNHFDLGSRIGKLFTAQAHRSLEACRKNPDWSARTVRAGVLLEAAERHFPHYVEEMRGYASGAGIDFGEFWAVSLEGELDPLPAERCTTIVANGGRTIAHNEDFDPGAAGAVCLLRRKIGNLVTLDLFYFNTLGGNGISVNSHGVVHAVNSLAQSDRRLEGVPRNVVARFFSDCADPGQAAAGLQSVPRSSGYNHNLLWPGGFLNIESSALRSVVSRPALPFVHSNHYLGPLATLEANDNSSGTRERYEAACGLARADMSIDDLKGLLSDCSRGAASSIMNERTVARVIVDTRSGVAHIWLRDEADKGWLEYPLNPL